MTDALHIDFETRSAADLKKVGMHVYAEHPTTDVLCMGWALDDDPVQVWTPGGGGRPVKAIGNRVVAHNAPFELCIWNKIMVPRYGWPPLQPEQTYCTAAMARAMALPGSLEQAAAAAGLDVQKDMAGHKLMMKLSRPRRIESCPECDASGGVGGWGEEVLNEPCPACHGTGSLVTWWDDPAELERLYEYCKTDVETERALEKKLLQLTPFERRVWLLDYEINERGIWCDTEAAAKALEAVKWALVGLNAELDEATGGRVTAATQAARLLNWVRERGVETESLDKATLRELLAGELPDDVRRALEIRQTAAKSSTAKLVAMIQRANVDGRIRGTMIYSGAGTRRWTGSGIQPLNLPRPEHPSEWIEEFVRALAEHPPETLDVLYGPLPTAVADSLRLMLGAPPDRELIAGDWSAIEARVLAWLAGQEDVLDVFRAGGKIYEREAGSIYNVPPEHITKDDTRYMVGKVSVLAFGYQGGIGASMTMAKAYAVDMEAAFPSLWAAADRDTRLAAAKGYRAWKKRGGHGCTRRAGLAAETSKLKWRGANPFTVGWWKELNEAAINAVRNPGTMFTAGKVAFRVSGSALWCRLPGGGCLSYPYPQIKYEAPPWEEEAALEEGREPKKTTPVVRYKTVDQETRKWRETATYGGKLAENITQAVARDILVDALFRLRDSGYETVLHIYDEAVVEVAADEGSAEEVFRLMAETPGWAPGLPLAVDGWRGRRYRK